MTTGCSRNAIMENISSNVTTEITSSEHAIRIVLATFAILVIIVGIFGNTLVILSVGLSQKLQTATNVFVTNLAVADLITCSVVPWNIVALLSTNGWPVAEWICSLAAFTLFLCIACSIWNLANIAINRYFVITLPIIQFKQRYTRNKIIIMVILTWFVPALLIGVPILAGVSDLGYDEDHGTCSDRRQNGDNRRSRLAHILVQALVLFIIPMIVIIVCYIKIYCHVRIHLRQMSRKAMESVKDTPVLRHKVRTRNKMRMFKLQTEITKNSFYIVCAFLTCVIPFAVTLSVYQEGSRYASMLLLANAAINPLIYSIKHPHFKKVFFAILRCQWDTIPGRPDFLRSGSDFSRSRSRTCSFDELTTKEEQKRRSRLGTIRINNEAEGESIAGPSSATSTDV